MVNVLVAAALTAATSTSLPAAVSHAEPAMFVVRDGDTTVYIFGTFHALDGEGQWFHDEVRDAFESSNELILETVIPEVPVAPPTFAAAPPQRIRGLSVTPSASFLATTRMAINAGRSQGMQVDNGADMVLREAAEAEGKPVGGLETLEFQLNMFDRMPAAETAAPKPSTPTDAGQMDKLSRSMADLQAAWKRGDQSVFVNMLNQLRQSSPATYRMMFTERNARWADWIAARMRTPGTVFVAVGAGHLVGKDSLLVRLGERGIESARLN
jgi:uncharacterized protein